MTNPQTIKAKALSAMPTNFSGKRFCKELRKLGYPEEQIWKSNHLSFLHRYCAPTTYRSWTKKQLELPSLPIKTEPKPYPVQSELDKAIQLIKSAGFRVMKQEWTEI